MIVWFSLEHFIYNQVSTFHCINTYKCISTNCPLQCSIMVSFWWHSFKYSCFKYCLIFSWASNILELKSICYCSCIPSAWVTHLNLFIFMNISYTIGIACIVDDSCCISVVFISHTKHFNLVVLFRWISPVVF